MNAPPITVLVTRRVRPGRAAEFEQLMAGMLNAASGFPGHLGGYLIKPSAPGDRSYHMLFAFDSEAHLQIWIDSAERGVWLEKIAEVTLSENSTRILTGLEGWFALPSQDVKAPLARYKMALVTWLGIFPLVMLLSALIGPLLQPISPVLSVVVVTALVVVCMTWAVMPLLTRVFAWWLYPKAVQKSPDERTPRQ
jgi:uncharacterized protein